MKRLFLLLLVAPMLLAWALFHAASAQTPPATFYLGGSSRLLFEHSGLDQNGKPETLKDCEYGLTSPLVTDLNQQPTPQVTHATTSAVAAGSSSLSLSAQYAAPEGQYRLWARVRDAAGNATRWHGGILVSVDKTPPADGTNFRILLDGQASIEVNGGDILASFKGKIARE